MGTDSPYYNISGESELSTFLRMSARPRCPNQCDSPVQSDSPAPHPPQRDTLRHLNTKKDLDDFRGEKYPEGHDTAFKLRYQMASVDVEQHAGSTVSESPQTQSAEDINNLFINGCLDSLLDPLSHVGKRVIVRQAKSSKTQNGESKFQFDPKLYSEPMFQHFPNIYALDAHDIAGSKAAFQKLASDVKAKKLPDDTRQLGRLTGHGSNIDLNDGQKDDIAKIIAEKCWGVTVDGDNLKDASVVSLVPKLLSAGLIVFNLKFWDQHFDPLVPYLYGASFEAPNQVLVKEDLDKGQPFIFEVKVSETTAKNNLELFHYVLLNPDIKAIEQEKVHLFLDGLVTQSEWGQIENGGNPRLKRENGEISLSYDWGGEEVGKAGLEFNPSYSIIGIICSDIVDANTTIAVGFFGMQAWDFLLKPLPAIEGPNGKPLLIFPDVKRSDRPWYEGLGPFIKFLAKEHGCIIDEQ